MALHLKVKAGPHKGAVFELSNETIGIGRDCPDGIQILDQGASRRHAEFFKIGEMCFIRDLKSRNGTFVNEEAIQEEMLQIGDKVRIGATVMQLEDSEHDEDGKAPAAAAQPEVVEFEHKEVDINIGQTIVLDLDKGARPIESGQDIAQGKDFRNLQLIYEVSKTISAEKSIAGLMQDVLKIVGEAVDSDAAFVFVRDKGSGNFLPKASWHPGADGPLPSKPNPNAQAVSTSIVKKVIDTGKPILTSDASEDQRFAAMQSVVLKQIRSVICTPLKSRDVAHGVIYLNMAKVGRTFSAEDLEIVAAISLQTALAMDSMIATQRQRETLFNIIRGLITILEDRDPTMRGHSTRVMNYTAAISQEMNVPPQHRYWVELAALLHDVGKLGVTNLENLVDVQRYEEIVKSGEKLIRSMRNMDAVLPGIRYQYARLDGSGYPPNVLADEVPLMGRILCVAKDYDILTTIGAIDSGAQGQAQGLPVKDVLMTMAKQAGVRYDNEVIQALLRAHKKGTLYNPQPIFKNLLAGT